MNIITSPRRSSPRKYTLSNYSIAVARWNVILTLQGKNLLIRIQRKLPSYDFLSNTAAKLVSIREDGLTWIVPLVFFIWPNEWPNGFQRKDCNCLIINELWYHIAMTSTVPTDFMTVVLTWQKRQKWNIFKTSLTIIFCWLFMVQPL